MARGVQGGRADGGRDRDRRTRLEGRRESSVDVEEVTSYTFVFAGWPCLPTVSVGVQLLAKASRLHSLGLLSPAPFLFSCGRHRIKSKLYWLPEAVVAEPPPRCVCVHSVGFGATSTSFRASPKVAWPFLRRGTHPHLVPSEAKTALLGCSGQVQNRF